MREAAVVLGIRGTTHGPRLIIERVSHGDCSAVLHPRTIIVIGSRAWLTYKINIKLAVNSHSTEPVKHGIDNARNA